MPFVPGKASSSLARDYAGKSIVLEPNKFDWQSLDLQFKQKEVIMTVTETDGTKYNLSFGYKQWKKTSTDVHPPYSIEAKGRFNGIEGAVLCSGQLCLAIGCDVGTQKHIMLTGLQLSILLSALTGRMCS